MGPSRKSGLRRCSHPAGHGNEVRMRAASGLNDGDLSALLVQHTPSQPRWCQCPVQPPANVPLRRGRGPPRPSPLGLYAGSRTVKRAPFGVGPMYSMATGFEAKLQLAMPSTGLPGVGRPSARVPSLHVVHPCAQEAPPSLRASPVGAGRGWPSAAGRAMPRPVAMVRPGGTRFKEAFFLSSFRTRGRPTFRPRPQAVARARCSELMRRGRRGARWGHDTDHPRSRGQPSRGVGGRVRASACE